MVARRKQPTEYDPEPEEWRKPLSPKQLALFGYIRKYAREKSFGPDIETIKQAFSDIGASSLSYNLRELERIGYVLRVSENGTKRIEPSGKRALREADLWRLVDNGHANWSGGKPQGNKHPVKLTPGPLASDYIVKERDRLRGTEND